MTPNYEHSIDKTMINLTDKQTKKQQDTLLSMTVDNAISSVAVSFILSLGCFFFLNKNASMNYIVYWYILLLTSFVLRIFFYISFKKKTAKFSRSGKKYLYATLSTGFLWGIGCLIFFPVDSASQMIFSMSILGICAGASTTLFTEKLILNTFLCFILLPLAYSVSQVNGGSYSILAIYLIIYLLFLINTGAKLYKSIKQSIAVNLYNESLVEQQKENLRELETEKDNFKTLFNKSPDGLLLIQNKKFIECNEAIVKMLKYTSKSELLNTHPSDLSPEKQFDGRQSYEKANEMMEYCLQNGSHTFHWQHKKANGESFWADISLTKIIIDNIETIYVRWLDINKQKQFAEEQKALITKLNDSKMQLLQAEKMSSLGQLSAGLAHEINTPISYVNSNIQTIAEYVDEIFKLINLYEDLLGKMSNVCSVDLTVISKLKNEMEYEFVLTDMSEIIEQTKSGIRCVIDIIKNLKDFSRVDSGNWQISDLHKGLDDTLKIVNNEIKYNIEIKKEYGEIPYVECLISQLNQVFLNLIINAVHAIEKKGVITIKTYLLDEDNVVIEIKDTGKGVPESEISKIFNPFFTTKPVGKGTGLGLSLSYSIIKKHSGEIEVESVLGEGTVFKLVLPIKRTVPIPYNSTSIN